MIFRDFINKRRFWKIKQGEISVQVYARDLYGRTVFLKGFEEDGKYFYNSKNIFLPGAGKKERGKLSERPASLFGYADGKKTQTEIFSSNILEKK